VRHPRLSLVVHLVDFIAVVFYSRRDQIPQEAPYEIAEHQPPAQWPDKGAIEFKDIRMSYRKGLPEVLKGKFPINPAMHILDL
jgi:hypothetical protein